MDDTFNPAFGAAVTVSATTSSANVAIGRNTKNLVFTNLGSAPVYVDTGLSTITASTADYCVLPGTQVSLTKRLEDTHVGFIAASGTQSLHIIPGLGF